MPSHIASNRRPSNRARHRGPVLVVLAWMLICQFPLPLAHAHDVWDIDSAAAEVRISRHLELYHAGSCLAPDCVHWHYVIPWTLISGVGEEDDAMSPPGMTAACEADPSAGWSAGELMHALPVGELRCGGMPWAQVGATRPPRVHPGGFLGTYEAVAMTQLTCVVLC